MDAAASPAAPAAKQAVQHARHAIPAPILIGKRLPPRTIRINALQMHWRRPAAAGRSASRQTQLCSQQQKVASCRKTQLRPLATLQPLLHTATRLICLLQAARQQLQAHAQAAWCSLQQQKAGRRKTQLQPLARLQPLQPTAIGLLSTPRGPPSQAASRNPAVPAAALAAAATAGNQVLPPEWRACNAGAMQGHQIRIQCSISRAGAPHNNVLQHVQQPCCNSQHSNAHRLRRSK